MRTKERIRGVNDVVGDRVKREAVKVAGLAPSAELVRTLAKDEDVRAAAREVLSRAEKLRGELSHGGQVGRLARDPKLQNDVAALIRSTAGALDAGVSAGKRRARRRVFRFLLVGSALAALGVWLNKKRQESAPWHHEDAGFADRSGQGDPGNLGTGVRSVHPVGTGAAMTGSTGGPTGNGGSTGNGTAASNGEGQSKPTPAASAERVETEGPTG
jgi:hypothetical protein